MKITLVKTGPSRYTVRSKRTRRWERRAPEVQNVPREQLEDALAETVAIVRADRPAQPPGSP